MFLRRFSQKVLLLDVLFKKLSQTTRFIKIEEIFQNIFCKSDDVFFRVFFIVIILFQEESDKNLLDTGFPTGSVAVLRIRICIIKVGTGSVWRDTNPDPGQICHDKKLN